MNLQLRINGTAPAWPLLLEHSSAFYQPENTDGLGSASYSIISFSDESKTSINWELLIDAGHNTAPFLLNHGNRIPDAIFLTHGHPDHILSVDWIVQSHHYKYREQEKRMPVYCTRGVWNTLLRTYSYIEPYVWFKELVPGKKLFIEETSELYVTPYPVFHGKAAWGAGMFYFESSDSNIRRILITGDMLCPLLRKKDIPGLSHSNLMFIDMNNRFPYPLSNHTSFADIAPHEKDQNMHLRQWYEKTDISDLIVPHTIFDEDKSPNPYFDEILSDWHHISEIPHTIIDLINLVRVPVVFLVHYLGLYDQIIYREEILSSGQLEKWANGIIKEKPLGNTHICIPKPGDYFSLIKVS